jgi:hypothetical protein
MGPDQPLIQLAAPGQELKETVERLVPMGSRRVGAVEILENNPLRLRLANTWYFPTRAGEWASLAVRQIRWEYTFYSDKRWVTHLEINNSGGGTIGALRIHWPQLVAIAGGKLTQEIEFTGMLDVVQRWDFLTVEPDPKRNLMQQNFLKPAKIVHTLTGQGEPAAGDVDRDGFDESQGCYFLTARAGHCRFTVMPPEGGLHEPAFRVQGKWQEMPSVNCEGMAIRNAVRLEDGSLLFVLHGNITRPTAVEVVGPVGYLDAKP